jgi:hypothetical protein
LRFLAWRINGHLARWAMQKVRRFRGKFARAMEWLQKVYQHQRELFARWQLIAFTASRSPHRSGERLDLVAADVVALAHELRSPLLPYVVKELPVARDDPRRLLKDGRDDSLLAPAIPGTSL